MPIAKHLRRWVPRLICGLFALSFAVLVAEPPVSAGSAPLVVVSLKPLHSLVVNIMDGVAQPVLLMSGSESPHSFALKPSQARELQRANAVFWVGPQLERFLVSPLQSLAKDARIVSFVDVVPLLRYRKEGVWTPSAQHEAHGEHNHGDAQRYGVKDPHFWLDPVRVRDTVAVIEQILSEIDPANAAIYGANAARLHGRLDALHRQLKAILAPVREVPYLVSHDAYQYFETRYRLAAVGSLVLNPEIRPGARHVAAIRRKVAQSRVRCVFREPQIPTSVLSVISDSIEVRIGELDPMGAMQSPGPEAYFRVLTSLAENMAKCLGFGES